MHELDIIRGVYGGRVMILRRRPELELMPHSTTKTLVPTLVSFHLLVPRSNVHGGSLTEVEKLCSHSGSIQQRQTNARVIGALSNGSGGSFRQATLSDEEHPSKTLFPAFEPNKWNRRGLRATRARHDNASVAKLCWSRPSQ